MDDAISRAVALDALADYIHKVDRVYSTGKLTHEDCMDAAHSVLDELPPTCHLLEDGTLIVTVPNLSEVHRVIVDEENSQYCKTFYQDGNDGDYDYCEECRIYGDDYSYDRDGDLVSNCYDCPMNSDGDAWMRGCGDHETD